MMRFLSKMDNFLFDRKYDEPAPLKISGPVRTSARINSAVGPRGVVRGHIMKFDMYAYADTLEDTGYSDGYAAGGINKSSKDVAVEYNGRSVQFPCSATLRVCVEKSGGSTCVAEVHDASGRLLEKFAPNLESEIREDAEASVMSLANGLIERLSMARADGSVVVKAASGNSDLSAAQGLVATRREISVATEVVLFVAASVLVPAIIWWLAGFFVG